MQSNEKQPFLLSKELSEKLIKNGYLKTTFLDRNLNLVLYSSNWILWGDKSKYTVSILVEEYDTKQMYAIRGSAVTEREHNNIIKCSFPDTTSNGSIVFISLKKVETFTWVDEEEENIL